MNMNLDPGHPSPSDLLKPVPAHARHKRTWSPALLTGVLWRCVINFGAHRKVIQLLKLPPLAEAARLNPRFAYKYLTHDFLARGLTTAERANCFLHHYRRIHAALPEWMLRQTLDDLISLFEIYADGRRFNITMGMSRDFDKEGEFSLNLHVNGEIVFLLSFTIVPGAVVRSQAVEAILISRLQGMKGSYREIHSATKTLHDVAPDALLFSALQGLAIAFKIHEIAGVGAALQSSCTKDLTAAFNQAYDQFFSALGIAPNAAGFYITPVPAEPKPLEQVKKGHKLRTKEKRAFKLSVQQACTDFLTVYLPASPAEKSAPAAVEALTTP
jgi:uncharacterized protein VirK/YbjX